MWLAVGSVVVVVLLLAPCEYVENPNSYFATYEVAKESGIMDRGWIPTYIPKSSRGIHERHKIDTNQVTMSFRYDPEDTSDVESNCVRSETIANGRRYFCEYFGSLVQIDLYSDGTARLSSHRT